ncbi:MAG: HlyD family secretion protein [Flavobacteriaceae bacterium]|nr:HlyD family secretion protein [Flavobacteriaceae bacterium]
MVVGSIFGIYKFIYSLHHENTDDAQVDAYMIPVIPRVGGYIERVYVTDNQPVKKGDTLFTIDSRDYQVKLEQARANLEMAESNFLVSRENIGSYRANTQSVSARVRGTDDQIKTAEVKLWRAQSDYERYKNLYDNHSISAQQYEKALAARQEAENALKMLENEKKAAASQRNAASTQAEVSKKQVSVAEANIKSAEAVLNAARLDMDYTVVTAAIDGQLSNVDIQPGQYVQPGQSLFYLVNTAEKWVIANFKETQMEKLKPGQNVSIEADAYPGEDFEGIITNFSPATGAKFSLLPPDNATGNFVKTVQRIPVKIDFTKDNDAQKLAKLRSGMNVYVDVHIK